MGDRNDFLARLFERNRTSLYRFLLRSTGRADEAEDLTQEVFLRVMTLGPAGAQVGRGVTVVGGKAVLNIKEFFDKSQTSILVTARRRR